ncbi:MAG: hypothetical protein ACRYHQ_22160 [Janthinobacterium lividum]
MAAHTDTNTRKFASTEAERGIMTPAKLAGPQAYERANYLKIIQGYQGAHA